MLYKFLSVSSQPSPIQPIRAQHNSPIYHNLADKTQEHHTPAFNSLANHNPANHIQAYHSSNHHSIAQHITAKRLKFSKSRPSPALHHQTIIAQPIVAQPATARPTLPSSQAKYNPDHNIPAGYSINNIRAHHITAYSILASLKQ